MLYHEYILVLQVTVNTYKQTLKVAQSVAWVSEWVVWLVDWSFGWLMDQDWRHFGNQVQQKINSEQAKSLSDFPCLFLVEGVCAATRRG